MMVNCLIRIRRVLIAEYRTDLMIRDRVLSAYRENLASGYAFIKPSPDFVSVSTDLR